MSKQAIRRIATRDMKEIENMELKNLGIYINFNETNILEAKAIIIGPKNTPFENGVFYFNILFPNNYPYSPPNVQYYSTSRYRIHPNLYIGKSQDNFLGKVCLSIINTWSGPKWTSIMHIGSIMLSIQSLLDENPLHNEPGFENESGYRNDIYNLIVEHDTFQNLILRNCFTIPEKYKEFEGIIKENISKEKLTILSKLETLCEKYPSREKVSSNIYNITIIMDYPRIQKQLQLNLI